MPGSYGAGVNWKRAISEPPPSRLPETTSTCEPAWGKPPVLRWLRQAFEAGVASAREGDLPVAGFPALGSGCGEGSPQAFRRRRDVSSPFICFLYLSNAPLPAGVSRRIVNGIFPLKVFCTVT